MPIHPHDDGQERVYVARLPILDDRNQVFGYQLLSRAAVEETSAPASGDQASARVLDDALLSVGLDTLTGGRPAFLSLTRDMLLTDAATLLPPKGVVFELGADLRVDDAVVEACRALSRRGYVLALADFTPGSPAEALLPHAKFAKVDVTSASPTMLTEVAGAVRSSRGRVIATHVETPEAFDAARATCALFQGYYFCTPRTFAVRAMSTRQLTQLSLMAALNQPHVSLGTIEDLLKRDPRLSYRVLRCVNSAAFGLRREVHSIREALLLLGLDQIRKWASIWSLVGINGGSPELVTVTVLRARCCELVGASLGRADSGEYFLLGLCSLLDVILQRPMDAAVEDLPLTRETRDALLGHDNDARQILDAVTQYERGDWDDATRTAARVGLDPDQLPAAYHRALAWARQITTVAAQA